MSLSHLLDVIDELDRRSLENQFYGHDFGLGLHPHHIHHHRRPVVRPPVTSALAIPALLGRLGEHRPATHVADLHPVGGHGPISPIGKDGFQVCMDVSQFKPSELNVKVVDNAIIVEGKHEEREDGHGYISRHFVRRYDLPKDYDADKVASSLSSDGVLTVSIPKPQIEDKNGERVIQIQQTGPAHLNVKANSADKGTDATNGGDGN